MAPNGPHPAINQLIREVDGVRRRAHPWPTHPTLGTLDVDAILSAIRAGRDDELRALVELCQRGDSEATTLALWAVYPLMIRMVRTHVRRDQVLGEDFLALGYTVLRDIDSSENPLAPKIVSRTLRRSLRQYERSGCRDASLDAAVEARAGRLDRGPLGDLVPGARTVNPSGVDDVSDQALARVELHELRRTIDAQIRQGRIAPWQWELVLEARVRGGDPVEIAARYGLSRVTARSNVFRTVGRLRGLVA